MMVVEFAIMMRTVLQSYLAHCCTPSLDISLRNDAPTLSKSNTAISSASPGNTANHQDPDDR